MADEASSDPSVLRLIFPKIESRDELALLFNAEKNFMVREDYGRKSSVMKLRLYALDFMENQWRSLRLDSMVPYMAINYFDRLMSNGDVPRVIRARECNTNLSLICCLTIALKILLIADFKISDFLCCKNYVFEKKDVLEMELFICTRLEWRLHTVTPFAFIGPFMPLFSLPRDLPMLRLTLRSVRMLLINCQSDIMFTQFRPSVLAISALTTVISNMHTSINTVQSELNILFPDQFVTPLEDMVLLCNKKMTQLYKEQPVEITSDDPDGPGPRAGKRLIEYENDDQLMNFELRWKEAIGDAELGQYFNDGCMISFMQKLVECFPLFTRVFRV